MLWEVLIVHLITLLEILLMHMDQIMLYTPILVETSPLQWDLEEQFMKTPLEILLVVMVAIFTAEMQLPIMVFMELAMLMMQKLLLIHTEVTLIVIQMDLLPLLPMLME